MSAHALITQTSVKDFVYMKLICTILMHIGGYITVV